MKNEEILREKQWAAKPGLDCRFVFQHDSDQKHTSPLVKNYLQSESAHWIPLNICKVKERPRSMPKDHQISSISLSFLLFRTILNSMPCILTRQKQPSVFLPPLSRSPSMFLLCIMLSYSFSYILHLFRFVIWTLSNVSRGVLLQFYPPTFLSLFSWHFNYANLNLGQSYQVHN